MRSIVLVVLSALLIYAPAFSQVQYNNKWCFGYHNGMDFTTGTPVLFTDSIQTTEGCASVCDAAGNLLFYSEGNQVYNSNNQVMTNGAGIFGNGSGGVGPGSATQGVAIVQSIANRAHYYLFVLDASEESPHPGGGKLRYSVVDMTLNGGLGDVVAAQKNVIIGDSLCEKMFVTKGSGCSYWLMVHSEDSGVYKAYKIDFNGIAAAPVVSHTGVISSGPGTSDAYDAGEMKISPNDSMIAMVSTSARQVELSYFDRLTGVVTSAVKIDSTNEIHYGVSFSPDNRRLYVTTWTGIYQYDLTLMPDIAAVTNSKVTLTNTEGDGTRLGPDNKLYVEGLQSPEILCINDPNALGLACNITYPLSLPPTIYPLYPHGFGNAIVIIPMDTITSAKDTAVCLAVPFTLSAPAGYATYLWSDGKSAQTDTIVHPGTKWVSVFDGCTYMTDTFRVSKVNTPGCSPADVAEVAPYALAITPNPSYTGVFYFPQLDNERQLGLEIFDCVGSRVLTLPYRHLVDLGRLARGVYFYRVTGNGTYYNGKLLYE